MDTHFSLGLKGLWNSYMLWQSVQRGLKVYCSKSVPSQQHPYGLTNNTKIASIKGDYQALPKQAGQMTWTQELVTSPRSLAH